MGDLIKQLIGLGLPVLGTALGGPLGGAVAGIIAHFIGAPTTTDPTQLSQLLQQKATDDKDVLIAQLKQAEDEYLARVQAQVQMTQAQLSVVNTSIEQTQDTMRVELTDGPVTWFAVFQRSWRPLFAYELLAECSMFFMFMVHDALNGGSFKMLGVLLQYESFLVWYYGMRFAVIGVYTIGRSFEKTSGTVDDAPPPKVQQAAQKAADAVLQKVKKAAKKPFTWGSDWNNPNTTTTLP